MFEIDEIVKVEIIKETLLCITHWGCVLRSFFLEEIATMSQPLVQGAIANHDNYRFFIDSQGYLVITRKETAHV